MIGQSFKCSRVDQITSVDTTAHLMTIRDLEEKLSNHHRRDRVPVWAESLIRRVEELENSAYKISSISQLPSVPSKCTPVLPSSTLPDDVATFNAKIDEMKSYLESQVSSSQHHQASRIEMVHSEIERLHSLMSIRPTTADFQLVVVSLNDVHRRMYDSLDDIAAGIGGTVQEKVATEMDFFMQQLSKNEKSNTKRIQVALDKTERINTSILELSEVTGASITSLTQGMKEEMSALRRDIRNTNKTSSEKSKSLFDMSIADLEISMKKADMATKARVEELSLQCADERFLVISSSVTDTREAVKALTTGMEFDHGNVLEYSKSEKGTIHQALAAVIQSLGGQKICSEKKDDPVEIIPLLEEHEALIKDNATQLKIMEDKFEAICAQQAQLEEGLGKKIAALIDKNVQKEEEVAKAVNTSLRQAHVKITELSNCAEEQRESIARLDRITKSAQVNIERIASVTDHLASDMESFKSRVMGLIDDMKRICLDFIVEKHEELVKQCIFLQ